MFADGAVLPRSAPGIVTLTLEIEPDVFGTACPVEQLDTLDPAGYPALRHLDLGHAENELTAGLTAAERLTLIALLSRLQIPAASEI